MRPAVFLDRDGTLIEEHGYVTPASVVRVFPWTVDAIRLLNRAGFAIVVVTNQGGIARGVYSANFVELTHRLLAEQFATGGATVDAWEYCPHHPEGILANLRRVCLCRKPGPGMVRAAAQRLGNLDLARSWVVGDHWRDVQLGHAVGGRSILVRSGHGAQHDSAWAADIPRPHLVADNLMEATARILHGN